jgi:large subunit ribosomal protein L29
MPKKENITGLTDEDLKKKLEDLVKGLMSLRFRKVTEGVENSAQFRKDRRSIARIKTLLRDRELKAAKK